MILAAQLIFVMFIAGLILGFVGAGGSGFIIAILSTLFGFPVHLAIGTALAAMLFSSVSGTISHYREGNIVLKSGLLVGLTGAVGAWFFSQLTVRIDEALLTMMTAGMLYVSSVILWLRMIVIRSRRGRSQHEEVIVSGAQFYIRACLIGAVCGALAGLFGIGATPFIQIGLMTLLAMPVNQAAGTTMLVIIPIALAGGAGFYGTGNLDFTVLLQVLAGIMTGSYIGAKFTKRLPAIYLKTAMIATPLTGATLLLL